MVSWYLGITVSLYHGFTMSWHHGFMAPQWILFTIGHLDFPKNKWLDLGVEAGFLFRITLHSFMHTSNPDAFLLS